MTERHCKYIKMKYSNDYMPSNKENIYERMYTLLFFLPSL